MRTKNKKYLALTIAALAIYPSVSFGIGYYYNVTPIQANDTFFTARQNLSLTDPFQYNFTLQQYYQYNITLSGNRTTDFAILNAQDRHLPYILTNETKNYGNTTGVPVPLISFVFFPINTSVFYRPGFSITHEVIKSTHYNLTDISLPPDSIKASDTVKSIPGSGDSYIVTPSISPIPLGSVPAGTYYLQLTIEFYNLAIGLPIPTGSFTVSLPFMILSWK